MILQKVISLIHESFFFFLIVLRYLIKHILKQVIMLFKFENVVQKKYNNYYNVFDKNIDALIATNLTLIVEVITR